MSIPKYEQVMFEAVHKPTGLRLQRPDSVPRGLIPNPYVLASAGWSANLHILGDSSLARALEMGEPVDAPGDIERFRRRFGSRSVLERIAVMTQSGRIAWDRTLIGIATTLFFIMGDTQGFRAGDLAYPDTIELNAPELPTHLHGVVRNKYAGFPS